MTKKVKEYKLLVAPGYPKLDAQNRLHCEFGPCLLVVPEAYIEGTGKNRTWKDGKTQDINSLGFDLVNGDINGGQIYRWHGIQIDNTLAQTIIEHPENLTIEFIDKLDNMEVKRIAIERYGMQKYLTDSGATVLDSRMVERKKSPNGGIAKFKEQLVSKDIGGRQIVGVFMVNSTPNGHFEGETIEWTPFDDFTPIEQRNIMRKYSGDKESLKEINGKLYVKQITEHGQFIPELDSDGNYIYKTYYAGVHPEIRPFWFQLDNNGAEVLDRDGDPEQQFGEPQKPTVHNAIASTFGLTGEEYAPDVES